MQFTGDGMTSNLDAYQIMEVSAGLDDGFDRFTGVEPSLIADMNRDGVISTFDAYLAFNS